MISRPQLERDDLGTTEPPTNKRLRRSDVKNDGVSPETSGAKAVGAGTPRTSEKNGGKSIARNKQNVAGFQPPSPERSKEIELELAVRDLVTIPESARTEKWMTAARELADKIARAPAMLSPNFFDVAIFSSAFEMFTQLLLSIPDTMRSALWHDAADKLMKHGNRYLARTACSPNLMARRDIQFCVDRLAKARPMWAVISNVGVFGEMAKHLPGKDLAAFARVNKMTRDAVRIVHKKEECYVKLAIDNAAGPRKTFTYKEWRQVFQGEKNGARLLTHFAARNLDVLRKVAQKLSTPLAQLYYESEWDFISACAMDLRLEHRTEFSAFLSEYIFCRKPPEPGVLFDRMMRSVRAVAEHDKARIFRALISELGRQPPGDNIARFDDLLHLVIQMDDVHKASLLPKLADAMSVLNARGVTSRFKKLVSAIFSVDSVAHPKALSESLWAVTRSRKATPLSACKVVVACLKELPISQRTEALRSLIDFARSSPGKSRPSQIKLIGKAVKELLDADGKAAVFERIVSTLDELTNKAAAAVMPVVIDVFDDLDELHQVKSLKHMFGVARKDTFGFLDYLDPMLKSVAKMSRRSQLAALQELALVCAKHSGSKRFALFEQVVKHAAELDYAHKMHLLMTLMPCVVGLSPEEQVKYMECVNPLMDTVTEPDKNTVFAIFNELEMLNQASPVPPGASWGIVFSVERGK